MDAGTRSVEEGKLFTAQAVAFKPGIGFVASVRGAPLPEQGTLRLGGDGRAASSQSVAHQAPHADIHAIAALGRCRVVLTTPGLFTQGWLPNGFAQQSDGHHWLVLHGVRARLVCATVPRAETISGWDLARWQPKAALRAAPTGSVYWLDQLQATPEALGKLAESGFWSFELVGGRVSPALLGSIGGSTRGITGWSGGPDTFNGIAPRRRSIQQSSARRRDGTRKRRRR